MAHSGTYKFVIMKQRPSQIKSRSTLLLQRCSNRRRWISIRTSLDYLHRWVLRHECWFGNDRKHYSPRSISSMETFGGFFLKYNTEKSQSCSSRIEYTQLDDQEEEACLWWWHHYFNWSAMVSSSQPVITSHMLNLRLTLSFCHVRYSLGIMIRDYITCSFYCERWASSSLK